MFIRKVNAVYLKNAQKERSQEGNQAEAAKQPGITRTSYFSQ